MRQRERGERIKCLVNSCCVVVQPTGQSTLRVWKQQPQQLGKQTTDSTHPIDCEVILKQILLSELRSLSFKFQLAKLSALSKRRDTADEKFSNQQVSNALCCMTERHLRRLQPEHCDIVFKMGNNCCLSIITPGDV